MGEPCYVTLKNDLSNPNKNCTDILFSKTTLSENSYLGCQFLQYNKGKSTWLGLTQEPLVQRYSPEAQGLIGGRAQPGNEMSSTAMSAADKNLDATN